MKLDIHFREKEHENLGTVLREFVKFVNFLNLRNRLATMNYCFFIWLIFFIIVLRQ